MWAVRRSSPGFSWECGKAIQRPKNDWTLPRERYLSRLHLQGPQTACLNMFILFCQLDMEAIGEETGRSLDSYDPSPPLPFLVL